MKKLIFFLILLIAIFLRFNNLNWDANQHLHPDERFLTMVGNAMKVPNPIFDYFNPQKSTLNPVNVGYQFFVYGRFPLILNKFLEVVFGNDDYNRFTIQGRYLSAFFDLLTVILVYKTTELLIKSISKIKHLSSDISLWSAFLYAVAVLPVQLSHFFAVDTFLNFFMFGSFYFALKFYTSEVKGDHKNTSEVFFSAIFSGLALASKVTAVFILPLILFFIFKKSKRKLSKFLILTSYFLIITYLTLRVADPYLFQSANFLDPRPNQVFINNLKTLQSFSGKDIWYPPAVQWIHKPAVIFSLVNLAVFGVGTPYFILVVVGIVGVISKIKDQRSKRHVLILIWALSFFLYQSTQFAQPMRYFIFIYPFLAIFAGMGINVILSGAKNLATRIYGLRPRSFVVSLLRMTNVVIIVILLVWPMMFSSIYFNKHTRVEASEWIYKNLPSGSLILGEEWDDPLPLGVMNNYGKQFKVEILPVFGMDTPEKWQKMNELLSKADYYVLSSNRGWGSIPTVPEKYPLMSKFYNELLANRCQPERLPTDWLNAPCYAKIQEFKPYYYRFFELPNHWVDESFTVYDHPTVMVFKNEKND